MNWIGPQSGSRPNGVMIGSQGSQALIRPPTTRTTQGAAHRDLWIVGGQHDHPTAVGDSEHEVDHLVLPLVVQLGGKLVGEQHHRIDDQRRAMQPVVAPARQLLHQMVGDSTQSD